MHVYIYVYTSVHLYIIMVCSDGMTIGLCPCVLLAAIGMVCYWLPIYILWCASILMLYNYTYICVNV